MRDQIGILALGQAGSNIGQEFEKLKYKTVYVNTSIEDLNSIKNGVHKIHIPNTDGAAKERSKVLEMVSDSIVDIADKITSILTQKYIVVVFASGGGTGSGLAPTLIAYLSRIGRVCMSAVILPNEQLESAKTCENAYNCMVEINGIQGIGATFLIDNSKVINKFDANKKFVKDFDAFVTINNQSAYGNIDNAEKKAMLSCNGISIISRSSKTKSTVSDIVRSVHDGIYSEIESKTIYYIGVSTSNKSLDINSLASEFGDYYDCFHGISESTTVVMLTGIQLPLKRIERLKNKFQRIVNNISINLDKKNIPRFETLKGLSYNCSSTINTQGSSRDILIGLLNKN